MDDEIYDDRWPEREPLDSETTPGQVPEEAQEPSDSPADRESLLEPPDTLSPATPPPAVQGSPDLHEPPIDEPTADESPEPLWEEAPADESPEPARFDVDAPADESFSAAENIGVEGESSPEATKDESPFQQERDFVESQSESPEVPATASEPAAEEPPQERVHTTHVGEDVVLLGQADQPAQQPAIVASDGSVLIAPEGEPNAALPDMDMGPERRGNAWVWVGLLVGFLIMASALGYAWWFFNERPISTPNVIGRLPAQAAQALNDAGLRVGKVTEMPTDTAPPGTVIQQSPKPDSKLKPGQAVSIALAGSPEVSKVPQVLGVSVEEAARVLANARLGAHIVESYNPTTPVGFVQSQTPTPGAEVEPGSIVGLIVSRGAQPASFRVPKLVGLPEADAATLLGTLEVRAEVFRSFDNSQPVGAVLGQVPLPDTQVPFDGVVQYLVCKGPGVSGVTVPDVEGMTNDKAVKRLKESDLKAKVSFQPSNAAPKGEVLFQLPAARTKTSAGETVGLVVSSGNPLAPKVPSMVGKTADEAAKALSSLGYRPVVVQVRVTTAGTGRVYLQAPAAGTLWPVRYPVMVLLAAP